MSKTTHVKLRPLEREDLRFVHLLDNNASVMRYWFEEPYETYGELAALYDEHIHDQRERRFVVEWEGQPSGVVELVEIDYVHRRAEFQIIIAPEFQGKGIASRATKLVHGGLRYLEYYEFHLVREALIEREILWRIAPHILHPMRFVLPLGEGSRPAWMIRAGLILYDLLAWGGRLPWWPSRSLTTLKRSRSRKSTAAIAWSPPRMRSRACSRRSMKSARLGSAVRWSV